MSPSDTLIFVTWRNECWAVYRGFRFRIEGRHDGLPWRTYLIDPTLSRVMWHTVGPFYEHQDDDRPWTTQFKGRNIRRVTKKVMKWIDAKIDAEHTKIPKWPECS